MAQTGRRTELKPPSFEGSSPSFGILDFCGWARARLGLISLGRLGALPRPAIKCLGRWASWLSRQSFKLKIEGSNPSRPTWFFVVRCYSTSNSQFLSPWPNWQGNGLLSRVMWVRLPPDSSDFEVCSCSLIRESGVEIACQYRTGAKCPGSNPGWSLW